jgi:hypothetical protein
LNRGGASCGALKCTKISEGRAKFVDKTVEIIGDEMPAKDYAQIMSRVLTRKITYNHVPREMHASMGFPRSCELADMFEFLRLHPKPTCSHHAMPIAFFAEIQAFETWLEKNVPKFTRLFEAEPIC